MLIHVVFSCDGTAATWSDVKVATAMSCCAVAATVKSPQKKRNFPLYPWGKPQAQQWDFSTLTGCVCLRAIVGIGVIKWPVRVSKNLFKPSVDHLVAFGFP